MMVFKDSFGRRCCAYFVISLFFILQVFVFSSSVQTAEPNLTDSEDYSVLRTMGNINESVALTALNTRAANAKRLQIPFYAQAALVIFRPSSLFLNCIKDSCSRWNRDGSSPCPNSNMALLI